MSNSSHGGVTGGHGRVDGTGGSVIDHRGGGGGGHGGGGGGGVVVGIEPGGYEPGPWGNGGIYVPSLCLPDPDDPSLCLDDRPIVGHPRALRYGSWGAPSVLPHTIVDFGTTFRHFSDPGMTRGFGRTLKFGGNGVDHAMSAAFRVGAGGKHLYGLVELEAGGLTTAPEMTQLTADSMTTTSVGYTGVVGIAEPIGKRARVAIEGAFGGRTLWYTLDKTTTLTATVPVVEARVRAETWMNPWMTLGATLGSSVIEKNDWMMGAYLGFHTRAYGGQR